MKLLLCFILITGIAGCGGGGGGGGKGGNPADVSMRVFPDSIDSGDRIEVTLNLSNIDFFDQEYVVVKLRYPSGLSYVQDSTILKTNNAKENFTSQFFSLERNADESTYLVTTLTEANLKGATNIEISTFLEGMLPIESGIVAVDVDHSDPERVRFDISNPQFTSLKEKRVKVSG